MTQKYNLLNIIYHWGIYAEDVQIADPQLSVHVRTLSTCERLDDRSRNHLAKGVLAGNREIDNSQWVWPFLYVGNREMHVINDDSELLFYVCRGLRPARDWGLHETEDYISDKSRSRDWRLDDAKDYTSLRTTWDWALHNTEDYTSLRTTWDWTLDKTEDYMRLSTAQDWGIHKTEDYMRLRTT